MERCICDRGHAHGIARKLGFGALVDVIESIMVADDFPLRPICALMSERHGSFAEIWVQVQIVRKGREYTLTGRRIHGPDVARAPRIFRDLLEETFNLMCRMVTNLLADATVVVSPTQDGR